MAVVSLPEFKNYMSGIQMSPIQAVDAQAILDGVQSELEVHLNRPLQQRRVLELVEADALGRAFLKITPIVAVYGAYYRTDEGIKGELIQNLPRNWFRRGQNFLQLGRFASVFVDYEGGLNGDLHPGIKTAIKRVAAREYVFKHGDGLAITNTELRVAEDPSPTAKGWTEEELKKFDRLRRRTVV